MLLKTAFAAAVASALASAVSADYTYPSVEGAFAGYDLIFNDDFAGSTLNSTSWTADWDCSGWGNGMRAAYTTNPKNLFIKDSMLNLKPVCGRLQPNKTICQPFSGYPECACEPTNVGNMDATSAQISTRQKFAFNQGKFRVRAKMSTGFYTWPAFWMYKDWPKGQALPASGEIDVMEGVGKRPQWWTAVIHYSVFNETGGIEDKVRNENKDWSNNLNDTFHVYGLDWTLGKFVWTIDEVPMWTLDYGRIMSDPKNINVFDDGYYHMILDVAVGGRMFGIGYGNKRPPYEELCADAATFTSTEIDYVRVYQEKGKHNFTTGAGPDLVKGSSTSSVPGGATCLFDGCVGSSWNQRVDDLLKPTTSGGPAPTGGASTSTTTRPSGASATAISGFVATVFMMIAALFAL